MNTPSPFALRRNNGIVFFLPSPRGGGFFIIISPFPIGRLISRKFLSPWCRRSVERRRELSEIRNSNIFSHIEYMRGEGACVQEFLKNFPLEGKLDMMMENLQASSYVRNFKKSEHTCPYFAYCIICSCISSKPKKAKGENFFILSFVRELVIPRRVEILFFPRSIPPYSDAAVQWWCPKLQPSRS